MDEATRWTVSVYNNNKIIQRKDTEKDDFSGFTAQKEEEVSHNIFFVRLKYLLFSNQTCYCWVVDAVMPVLRQSLNKQSTPQIKTAKIFGI